jgi:hypothetical protein
MTMITKAVVAWIARESVVNDDDVVVVVMDAAYSTGMGRRDDGLSSHHGDISNIAVDNDDENSHH